MIENTVKTGDESMGKLFGTDGVRGVANKELTGELAFKLGRAAAYYLTRIKVKETSYHHRKGHQGTCWKLPCGWHNLYGGCPETGSHPYSRSSL